MNAPRWLRGCVALLGAVMASTTGARPQEPCSPLGEADFVELVKAGVPTVRLKKVVTECGIVLQAREGDWTRRLRELGATADLVDLLAAPRRASAGEPWASPLDRREMRWIPPGSFVIGSQPDEVGREPDEEPRTVTIERGFWLEASEVTNAAYRRFVLANPAWHKDAAPRDRHDGNYLRDWTGTSFPAGRDDYPVTWVSAYAAEAYAAWAGKRLPTEPEWEYACRAGTSTSRWWGAAFDERYVNAGRDPAAVGAEARRNPWRLADMLGNVWEWTSTTYGPYSSSSAPAAPASTGSRVVRGAAAGSGPDFVRSANRNQFDPRACNALVGFRCAF